MSVSNPPGSIGGGRPGAGPPAPDLAWGALVQAIAAGDETALAKLYDATAGLVHGLVLRIVRDRGHAEETTLDVFTQVWRNASAFDPARGTAVTWLLTLARSRAIDRLRSVRADRGHEEPLDIAASRAWEGDDPADASELSERRRRVRGALAQLDHDQREAIAIAYFEGLSHTEIAARLGHPLGTVKSRIRSGMLRLRELLEPLEA